MKKILMLSLLVFVFLLSSCQKKEVLVESITLDKTSAIIEVGKTLQVKATTLPENATNKVIEWQSTKNEVASVVDGLIKGESEGTAIIVASIGDKSATINISVEPIRYTLTFELNNGSPNNTQSVKKGGLAIKPQKPYREGYTFGGWFTNKECTDTFSFNTTFEKDITIYAKWDIKTYVATFISNGGSKEDIQNVNHGSKVSKPDNPTKANYSFIGWFIDEELKTAYNFDSIVNDDLTLYAKWEFSNIFIYFNENDGSNVDDQVVNVGEKVIEPDDPIREGYDFDGWYADATLTTVFDFNTILDKNTNIFAKWKVKQYTVVFITSDVNLPVEKVDYGKKISLPVVTSKDGQVLTWYVSEEYKEKYDFNSNIIDDLVLHGRWADSVSVVFDPNGGSMDVANYEYKAVSTINPDALSKANQSLGYYNDGYNYENAKSNIFIYDGNHELFSGEGEEDRAWWGYKIALKQISPGIYIVEKSLKNDNDVTPGIYELILIGIWTPEVYAGFNFLTTLIEGDIITIFGFNVEDTPVGTIMGSISVYSESDLISTYEINHIKGDSLPVPTKNGSTFAGWYDNPEFSGEPITTVNYNISLYAKWN